MTDLPTSDRIDAENENALAELLWEIDASQGLFKPMLAHCNYRALREYLVVQLRRRCDADIRTVFLHPSATKLFSILRSEIGDDKPVAVMVFGLESVRNIDRFLSLANWMRNEFQAQCPYPLVLWVNDDVVAKLIRLAPDFADFCTSAEFSIAPNNLVFEIRKASDRLFSVVLATGADRFPPNPTIFGPEYASELNAALRDLQEYRLSLPPELHATYLFALGRDAYLDDKMDEALELYRQSLDYWQSAIESPHLSAKIREELGLKIGALLFDMGLCHSRRGQLNRLEENRHCQVARSHFEKGIQAFEDAGRSDIAAKFIPHLGKTLGQLEDWDALSALAKKSEQLHQTYSMPAQLAGDYGFLAQVALQRKNWTEAREFATEALKIIKTLPKSERQHKGLYELLLGRAQRKLRQLDGALASLERARETEPDRDPWLYIEILNELRSLYYYDLQDYVSAFQVRQDRRSVERQFGFRAFIGASYLRPHKQSKSPLDRSVAPDTIPQEILSSGRQKDVKQLMARIGSTQHKLTIVYGQSGVGKSSLIQAGLIPALQPETFSTRDVAIVPLRVYTNWEREIGIRLKKSLDFLQVKCPEGIDSVERIIAQLKRNDTSNLLTVLIFDQFEEFFFTCQNLKDKKAFLNFLGRALDVPFVKAVISLREDYLHYLAIANRLPSMAVINNDILSRNILYYLGNFSPEDAKDIVRSLTENAQFKLDADLIDAFVEELARETGEVRPVELQIVGAQLQADGIANLEQYQALGAKDKLVERYLKEVIQDCGDRNERLARLVLYLLTDENNTRPLKTRTELVRDSLIANGNFEVSDLDLVLTIFAESGLVFVLPEIPEDRYQLVHDYLAKFIRQNQGTQLSQLQEELDRANAEKERSQQKLNRWLQSTLVVFIALTGMSLALWRQAETQKQIAEFRENSANAEALFATRELEALVEAMKLGQELQENLQPNLARNIWGGIDPKTRMQAVTVLREIVYGTATRNHLDARGGLDSVNFSPDGQTIVAFSSLEGVRLWDWQGQVLQTLPVGRVGVNAVRLSPDGNTLILMRENGTIEFWTLGGKKLQTLEGYGERIHQLLFSPDGQTLAILRADGFVELWQKTPDGRGSFQKAIEYEKRTNSVTFSPDSQTVAIGNEDGTVELRNRDGTLRKQFPAHQNAVTTVQFSPDGNTIATGSWDGMVKLWKATGDAIAKRRISQTTTEGFLGVNILRFSPDSSILAATSWNGTVELLNRDGELIASLVGDREEVTHLNFSSDSQTIATTGNADGVKLWNRQGEEQHNLRGQGSGVLKGYISPNGKTVAVANYDGTIQLVDLEKLDRASLDTLESTDAPIYRLRLRRDGTMVALVGDDRQLQLWHRYRGRLKTLENGDAGVKDFDVSPEGILVTVDDKSRIRLWSRDGEPVESLFDSMDLQMRVDRIGFAANGNLITIGRDETEMKNTIALWKPDGTPVARQPVSGDISNLDNVALSPDRSILALSRPNHTVQLWHLGEAELEAGEPLIGHRDRITHIHFGPDGHTIATASTDSTAKLWDLEGKLIENFIGHGNEVTSVAVSPSGNTIATASRDNTVKLWNLQGQPIETLTGHGDEVTHVSFHPNGKTLVTLGKAGKVIFWNLDLDDLLARGCLWLEDYLATHPEDLAELEICQTDMLLANAADSWVREGKTKARNGDLQQAMAAFQQAKTWNRHLEIDPKAAAAPAMVVEGEELAMNGRIDAAIAKYEAAQTLDPTLEISAESWDELCWYGSLHDRAETVFEACDRAVALNPEDGLIRWSRGIARGLMGDSAGAIEDFQGAIEWMERQDYEGDVFAGDIVRLEAWIASLKAGNNPLTAEELDRVENFR